MSKVTQVTVRYGRSVQPKPYETKEGLLEAVIIADEGEEVSVSETTTVLAGFIQQVHAALGLMKPAEAPVANSTDEPPKKTRKTRAKKDEKKAGEVSNAGDAYLAAEKAKADEVPVEGDAVADTGAEVVSVDEVVESTTEGVSDQELQSVAAAAAAKHGAAKVKDLMKEFGVTLLGKLDQPMRLEFLSKLDELDA